MSDDPRPADEAAPWDAELELRVDRRAERRLFLREGLILLLVAALVALRVILVHGS